ncbi:MAG: PD40 domain-containing protein [Acidobacteria bacterium]|nr:PD40 domain-containing protein [Acidobacteriota bacterium]
MTVEGKSHLCIRDTRVVDGATVTDSDDAGGPFWSPDGRTIAFLRMTS